MLPTRRPITAFPSGFLRSDGFPLHFSFAEPALRAYQYLHEPPNREVAQNWPLL